MTDPGAAAELARVGLPPPARWPADAPAAVGGRPTAERLAVAARWGLFCWPLPDGPATWWSPGPRAVLPVGGLREPRRAARMLRRGELVATVDRAFEEVVDGCADRPETWITAELAAGYRALHARGGALSVEVWSGRSLVAGVLAVRAGGALAGESMFHRRAEAGNAALVALHRAAADAGVRLIDVQQSSDHLRRLGAVELARPAFLAALACARQAGCGPLRTPAHR